jgi:hypothetical protein
MRRGNFEATVHLPFDKGDMALVRFHRHGASTAIRTGQAAGDSAADAAAGGFVVPLRAAAVAGTGGKALRAEATLGGPQDVE